MAADNWTNEPNRLITIIFTHWAMNEERSELARKSLESLIESLNTPCEIIVVDNGDNLQDSVYFLRMAHEKKITHYLRNADNLHFGYARNQAIKLAEGEHICIVDNDLIYQEGWLEECMKVFEKYPDKKLLASPVDYPTPGLKRKYIVGALNIDEKQFKLSMRAGSNCFICEKKLFNEIGNFALHRIAGSLWNDKFVRAGYLVAVTPQNMVEDMGFRKGYNLKADIVVEKTLTNNQKLKLK